MLIGYYSIFLFLGTATLSIGTGLLMTLKPGSSVGEWCVFNFGKGSRDIS